ncbi:D-glycerate dehydrogenase [Candidatus Bathyarchaeota archaeon RBG_16_48_13]|nr:MAG: D-glycerate dehydrogenase [Candidatus Bathyarchaeota archaeon RBG_16_48_13]
MKRFRVLVTRQPLGNSLDRLEKIAEVRLNREDRPMTMEEILEGVKDCDGLISLPYDRVDGELMDASGRLKVISNHAVGYDNIDVEAATKRGIMVTNTPDVLTETTADLAWALILATARRLTEAERYLRDGRWESWSPSLLVGTDVHGRVLGILGMGRIGAAVARRAQGFRMKVLYSDVFRNEKAEKELGIEYADLKRVLKESDFVSVHVPLMPSTHHFIGERELNQMKRSAIIVNTSRGPVVDEMALYRALNERRIAGAGLDVFESEPIDQENPLLRLDNVVLVPHIGSASRDTRIAMGDLAVENMMAALRGRIPPSLVNRELLKTKPLSG